MTGNATKLLALGLLALSCLFQAPASRANDKYVLADFHLRQCSERIEDAYRDRRMFSVKRDYPETYDLAIIKVMERCLAVGPDSAFEKHRPVDLIQIAAKRRSIDEHRKTIKLVTLEAVSEKEEENLALKRATEEPLSASEIRAANHLSLLLMKTLKPESLSALAYYLQGYEHKEIAELLQSTEAAIQQRVSRANGKIGMIVSSDPEFSGRDRSSLGGVIALAIFLALITLGIAGAFLGGAEDFMNAMSGKRDAREEKPKQNTQAPPTVRTYQPRQEKKGGGR